jgi:hypothetical protein
VEILLRIVSIWIGAVFTLFDAAFATNTDFGTALSFHLLQTVSSRTYKQTEEIDLWKFLDRDVDLFGRSLRSLVLLVFDRWPEVGVVFHGFLDKSNTFILQLFAVTDLTRISTATLTIIRRGRRRRAEWQN